METQTEAVAKGSAGSNSSTTDGASLSLPISRRGIRTSTDFAGMMSALMSDLIEGRVSPGVGNAVCNAGGKMLKVVEMQMKYGRNEGGADKVLRLANPISE